MKRKIVLILIFILIVANVINTIQDKMSRELVDHIEAGNFINTEDLDFENITMLHWFSKEVQVYSEDDKELCFVVFEPYKGLTLYKNKKLIMQNESPNFPVYQGDNYMIFSIDNNDYIENRVNFYSEVSLDNPTIQEYANNYFVGSYSNINKLIVTKKCIEIVSKILLMVSVLFLLITHKKKPNSILLSISLISMLFNFNIGIPLSSSFLYFYSDRLFKRSIKKWLIPILIVATFILPYIDTLYNHFVLFILPINFNSLYVFVFLLFSVINYTKEKNSKSIICLIGITSIYTFLSIDYEFSLFRLFYEEIFIFVLAIYLLIINILELSMYFSKEKMVRIDLLRGVSHDLRVPLSTIQLNTELLAKDDFTTEINKGMIFHTIKGAIDDLTYMTSSLTAYVSKDHYTDKKYKTSVEDCIHHTANYFYNNEKNIDIKTYICDEEIYLPIDEVWLNRLIYNLIDNAYKYTKAYGEIIIKLEKEKKKVFLSVEDNGIGMTEQQISKVLKPFYRVDKSRSISGLGLGLSIVKSIVEKLDGDIHIISKIGEGTKIIVEI